MARGTYCHREVFPGDARHIDLVALPETQRFVAGLGRCLTLTAGRRQAKTGVRERRGRCSPQLLPRHCSLVGGKNPPVDGEEVKLAGCVHRVGLLQVTQLLQSLIDEDEAGEGGEGFFSEAGDVAHQRAGVGGHQHYAQEGGPQPDARPQREIGERVLPGKPRENQGWKGATARIFPGQPNLGSRILGLSPPPAALL